MKENELLKSWQGIQDVELEKDLFVKYSEAREQYIDALSKSSTGGITQEELKKFSEQEKQAFSYYLKHRTTVKT